jgi:hypothetical protein
MAKYSPAGASSASIIAEAKSNNQRHRRGQPSYETKFGHFRRQVKRRIGPAWLNRDPNPDDTYDERA